MQNIPIAKIAQTELLGEFFDSILFRWQTKNTWNDIRKTLSTRLKFICGDALLALTNAGLKKGSLVMYIVKFWEFFVCEGQQFSPCSLSEIQRNSCWYVVPVSLWKLYRDFLCPISLSMYCRIWIQVTLASRCAFFSTERVSARETNYWVDQTPVLALSDRLGQLLKL